MGRQSGLLSSRSVTRSPAGVWFDLRARLLLNHHHLEFDDLYSGRSKGGKAQCIMQDRVQPGVRREIEHVFVRRWPAKGKRLICFLCLQDKLEVLSRFPEGFRGPRLELQAHCCWELSLGAGLPRLALTRLGPQGEVGEVGYLGAGSWEASCKRDEMIY